jgi:hypothetical protein
MKTRFMLALFLLGASTAFAQSVGNANVTSTIQFADHPQHAMPQALEFSQSPVLSFGSVYIAQGEMPLADVPLPVVHVVPLGDLARVQKKEHAGDKKAKYVWEN